MLRRRKGGIRRDNRPISGSWLRRIWIPKASIRFALASALLLTSCSGDGGAGNLTAPAPSFRAQRLTGISVVAPQTSIRVGQSVGPLVARGTYDDGPSATVKVAWASTDPAVLTVDENGVVTGVGVGVAKVTATFGPLTAEVLFEVTPASART